MSDTHYPTNTILSGISNDAYHAHSAISSSNCKDLLISPWLYKAKCDTQSTPTAAMEFGTMFHTMVLEPDTMQDRYFVADKPKRNTKMGKEEYEHLNQIRGDRTWLSIADFKKAEAMRAAIDQNTVVKHLLSGGKAEQSVFWADQVTGTLCKARPDYLNVEQGYIVDLKTTSSLACENAFKSTVERYQYHLSAAFYQYGVMQATGREMDFFFVVVETSAPHNYGLYKLGGDLLKQGYELFTEALRIYSKAKEKNRFDVPYHNGKLVELVA